MESPADAVENPLDAEDIAYPCKGCGDILEEGKAFELAGNRWHLNCFRCNTCGTLLDSDANLLLLGDGSLICNNCTYSCSACGNKIEDLAILTGDQAFCAACFRCRNCKRKIENLRYARTSQGIFCMNCHESLMARRRKKSRAAANAKKKDESAQVEKSLPALPGGLLPRSTANTDVASADAELPTELSPRPLNGQSRNGTSSRSSSARAQDRSPERPAAASEQQTRKNSSATARNARHSAMSQASEQPANGDAEGYFVPLALDPSPASTVTPTPTRPAELWAEPPSGTGDIHKVRDQGASKDVGARKDAPSKASSRELDVSPRIGPPSERSRQPSAEETMQIMDSIRKAQATGSRNEGSPRQAAGRNEDTRVQHVESRGASAHGQGKNDRFMLSEAPKGKRSTSSRSESLVELEGDVGTPRSMGNSGTPSSQSRQDHITPEPQEMPAFSKSSSLQSRYSNDEAGHGRSSQDTKSREDVGQGNASDGANRNQSGTGMAIHRKEAVKDLGRGTQGNADSGAMSMPLATPPIATSGSNKVNSGPMVQSPEEMAPPRRAPGRPQGPTPGNSYMAPRAPPPAPPSTTSPRKPVPSRDGNIHIHAEGAEDPDSPKLPRWSSGGDFTMEEDMARILGENEENSQSILRRVSNAMRHNRNASENSTYIRQHGRAFSDATARTATTSPKWPKTPVEDAMGREISSPLSVSSHHEDPATLRRQLRAAEQKIADLERQFATDKDLKNLNKKVQEKRKTVSALDSQTEIMLRQLEVLAGYVERTKDPKRPVNTAELEDSALQEFMQRLDGLKSTMSNAVQLLYEERNELLEEKNQIMIDRDRALMEFEQLSSKNAQLADMNNDLTQQIQERFKSQSMSAHNGDHVGSQNGLGIYATHKDNKISATVHLADDASMRPTTGTTMIGSVNSYPQNMEQEHHNEPVTVISAPKVVDIRKGKAQKFWKKGAGGISKGFKGAFSSNPERTQQWPTQQSENIGVPYNMTQPINDTAGNAGPVHMRQMNNDKQGGFGLFKKVQAVPKISANGSIGHAEHPSILFGSDLVERADFERRNIPSVVTRCIEEVELRGMDVEGIYRKTGGSGQVKLIQEGFDKVEDFDISDPGMDITAVTSVLKQYFRKLPNPLLPFEVYDRILESTGIENHHDRCAHLRRTFNNMPSKHRDCLEFLVFHLARVVMRETENLMTSKNIAVVFAPTIMRDHSLEREITDMHAKNLAVQFIIEHSNDIFGPG